jgi:putative transcriptional regulator
MNPTPEQIKQARTDAGLTQTQAAALLYKTCRAWQKWESGEAKMDRVFFEYFLNKIKSII